MKRVLFICQANVGRSQMAEGFYNALTKKSKAISAGIVDLRKKYSGHPSPVVITVMKEEGIDISNQKVKLVTPSILQSVDRIIVLCSKKDIPDNLQLPAQTEFYEVEDPYQQGNEKVRQIKEQIRELVLIVLKKESYES